MEVGMWVGVWDPAAGDRAGVADFLCCRRGARAGREEPVRCGAGRRVEWRGEGARRAVGLAVEGEKGSSSIRQPYIPTAHPAHGTNHRHKEIGIFISMLDGKMGVLCMRSTVSTPAPFFPALGQAARFLEESSENHYEKEKKEIARISEKFHHTLEHDDGNMV